MQIREILHGCDDWSLNFDGRLPVSVFRRLVDGCTIVVWPGRITESEASDAKLASASFHGVITQTSRDRLAGWQASWLLGKPNGDAPEAFDVDVAPGYSYEYYIGKDLPLNGITEGTISTVIPSVSQFTVPAFVDPGTGGARRSPIEARYMLDFWVDEAIYNAANFGANPLWRINPDLSLDFDTRASLARTGELLITDEVDAVTHSNGVTVVPGDMRASRSIEAGVSKLITVGERDASTGNVPTYTRTQTLPWKAPDGTDLDMTRIVDIAGDQGGRTDTGTRTINLATSRTHVDVSLSHPDPAQVVAIGDRLLVYSADEGVTGDVAVQAAGLTLKAKPMYVTELAWSPTAGGHTIMARTPTAAGTYIDLTDHVQLPTVPPPVRVALSDKWASPAREVATRFSRSGDAVAYAKRLARSEN